jgi:hypothetical protein
MDIELIPVIEIGYNNQDIKAPDKYPYWDYPEIWDKYHYDCYVKAGFKDSLKPYVKGSSFYKLTDISKDNLIKLTKDHTAEMREGKYTREQACAFFGGYVLRVDGKDKFFPQCCGDLSDIIYWEKLGDGQETSYEGHPAPIIKIKKDKIIFDFTDDEDDPFKPTPPEKQLVVDKGALKDAVQKAKYELNDFAKELIQINVQESLNINNIDHLLIRNDGNHE